MKIPESALSRWADELALTQVLGEEKEAFRGFNKIRLETLAFQQDTNVGNREVILDEASPTTSGSLNIRIFADSSPTNSEVEGEVVNDWGRGALRGRCFGGSER